ncbi:MAG: hypothetical protein Q8Q18_02995 [bacterium]|nr:hypothetical protein [bacterium]
MTQATHIVIAGAVAKPLIASGNPLAIFAVSLFSHYLSDAIPHGDYSLRVVDDGPSAMDREIAGSNKDKLVDISKVALDALVGVACLLALYRPEITLHNALIFGAIVLGGMLPDILQPMYYWFKRAPFTYTHAFHNFMHTQYRLTTMGYKKTAIISQLVIAMFSLYIIAL